MSKNPSPAEITRSYSVSHGRIPAAAVLAYMAKNTDMLPAVPNYGGYSIEEDILRVRLHLWKRGATLTTATSLAKTYRIPASFSEAKLVTALTESRAKKYRERESPPFPANLLCGSTLPGKGGKYQSVKNSAGICAWKKV